MLRLDKNQGESHFGRVLVGLKLSEASLRLAHFSTQNRFVIRDLLFCGVFEFSEGDSD